MVHYEPLLGSANRRSRPLAAAPVFIALYRDWRCCFRSLDGGTVSSSIRPFPDRQGALDRGAGQLHIFGDGFDTGPAFAFGIGLVAQIHINALALEGSSVSAYISHL